MIDLDQILENSFRRGERRRYYDRQDTKQQGDIKIAEHYLLMAYQAGMAGQLPSSALTQKQIEFLTAIINQHSGYFQDHGIIGGFA